MTLINDQQVENTLIKLARLEELIAKKLANPSPGPVHEASLESLARLAGKLKREIEEYRTFAATRA